MSSSPIPTAAVEDGDCRITTIHPEIIRSHIINRLDGRTLAIASCISVQFLSLCNDNALWKHICNTTWPSTADHRVAAAISADHRVAAAISAFSSGHRSFYSDASPALRHYPPRRSPHPSVPAASELISAVDIFYEDKLIHSNVFVTDAKPNSFLMDDIFMVEIPDLEELQAVPLNLDYGACYQRAEENLRLSWILIDPVKRRAINLSSQKAVEARRHSLTDDVQLRYSSVFPVSGGDGGSVMCAVFVHCTWKADGGMRVREVSMNLKASDGTSLTAIEGLKILGEAIEEKRWRSNFKREKNVYENFRVKRQRREIDDVRGESDRKLACVVAGGICVILTSCIHFFERVLGVLHVHDLMEYMI